MSTHRALLSVSVVLVVWILLSSCAGYTPVADTRGVAPIPGTRTSGDSFDPQTRVYQSPNHGLRVALGDEWTVLSKDLFAGEKEFTAWRESWERAKGELLLLCSHQPSKPGKLMLLFLAALPWADSVDKLLAMADASEKDPLILVGPVRQQTLNGILVIERTGRLSSKDDYFRERAFVKGRTGYRFVLGKPSAPPTDTEAAVLDRIFVKPDGRDDYVALTDEKRNHQPPSVERTAGDSKAGAADGAAEKLRTLKRMLDEGLITQDDYDQRKKAILDGMK